MNKQNSAVKTLEALGYTYNGGELWKPPIGKTPDFNLIDKLNARIKELESEKHINEIKAQGIEEAIQYLYSKCGCLTDVDREYMDEYMQKLRTKHD